MLQRHTHPFLCVQPEFNQFNPHTNTPTKVTFTREAMTEFQKGIQFSSNLTCIRRNLKATPVPWVHLRVRAAAVGILIGIVVVVVHVHVRLGGGGGGGRGRWHDLLLLLLLLLRLLLLLLHRRHHLLLLHLLLAHHLLPHHHVPAGRLGVGRNLRLTDVGHLHLWAGAVGPVPLHPHPPAHPLTPHHGPLAHGGRHGGTVHLAR